MTSSQGTGTGPAPAAPERITKAEFQRLYDQLRARPPWGPADRRGALNYITAETTLAAAGAVKLGRSVSLACPIEYRVTADNPEPARHKMTQTGDSAPEDGLSFAMDQIGMNIHGNADTHIDALSHVIYDGRLYNNRPADIVSDTGAAELSIAAAADGIVGRGVLLDVPRARGVPWPTGRSPCWAATGTMTPRPARCRALTFPCMCSRSPRWACSSSTISTSLPWPRYVPSSGNGRSCAWSRRSACPSPPAHRSTRSRSCDRPAAAGLGVKPWPKRSPPLTSSPPRR